jgi:cobalt-zinc-cadmium efflux system protein
MGHEHPPADAGPAPGGPAPGGPAPSGHSHGHSHAEIGPGADRRWLTGALVLLVGYMLAEVVVGVLSGSLALLTDAAHMSTDAGAIVLALVALRLAARPAAGNYTFGFKRVEILSAQLNGVTLWALALWFGIVGVRRLIDPPAVDGLPVLLTALAGIAVNLVAVWLLARADRRSMNVEGAFQHVLSDLYAFLATAVAGLVVLLTGWVRADAVAALLVAVLMARSGWGLVRDSWRVFLEAAPRGVDVAAIDADLHRVPGVLDVHDLHVWEVTSGFPNLSAHILLDPSEDCHRRRVEIAALITDRYGIEHITLQVDHRHTTVFDPAELARTART